MIVRIYDIDNEGSEIFRCQCDLQECFPGQDNQEDYAHAHNELIRSGRMWVGGGAAPLVLMFRVV